MATVSNRGTKDRPMWYCRYIDSDGKRKQRPTKQTTKAAALRFVAEIEARVARGLVGIPEFTEEDHAKKALTVADLAARFIAEYNGPRLKDRKRYLRDVRPAINQRLLPYPLAKLPVADVRKIDIANHRDALRRNGYMPATINTVLSYVHRMFSWAIDSEILDCRNPASRVERMRETPSEQRYTREQCEKLIGPDCDPMIATALYTGMRHGELRGLRWSDVRFTLGCIELKRSFDTTPKSGHGRTIPLHSELVPILREWHGRCPETAEDAVFPVRSGGTYRQGRNQDGCKVRGILQAAGVPCDLDHPWHAMRHTFATLLAESGASLDAISRILGHSAGGSAVTRGYVHSGLEFLSREIERLRLVPSQPANVICIADYRQTA